MGLNRKVLLTALGLAFGAVSTQISAEAVTADFDVTIQIVASCEIDVEDLNFGQHGIFEDKVTKSAALKVTCTNGSPYSIALDEGENPKASGDVDTRRMKGIDTLNATDYVAYNLYQDATGMTVWGGGASGELLDSTGSGQLQSYQIHGIVTDTNSTVGNYKDTITATVSF